MLKNEKLLTVYAIISILIIAYSYFSTGSEIVTAFVAIVLLFLSLIPLVISLLLKVYKKISKASN